MTSILSSLRTQPMVTPAAPLAQASSPSSYPPLVTPRPALGVSAQMHGVGVPASDSQSHVYSHHNLDNIAEVVGRLPLQHDGVERR
jgi:hypothetical protein